MMSWPKYKPEQYETCRGRLLLKGRHVSQCAVLVLDRPNNAGCYVKHYSSSLVTYRKYQYSGLRYTTASTCKSSGTKQSLFTPDQPSFALLDLCKGLLGQVEQTKSILRISPILMHLQPTMPTKNACIHVCNGINHSLQRHPAFLCMVHYRVTPLHVSLK